MMLNQCDLLWTVSTGHVILFLFLYKLKARFGIVVLGDHILKLASICLVQLGLFCSFIFYFYWLPRVLSGSGFL